MSKEEFERAADEREARAFSRAHREKRVKREPRDLGNGTSVVFVDAGPDVPYRNSAGKHKEQAGFYLISNTKAADGGRPFLRGPYATDAEAEAASLAVEWTADMLATEWPK